MWMIRSSGGQNVEEFLEKEIVAIGWQEVGSLAGVKKRSDVIKKVAATWPSYKQRQSVVAGSQLNKFANLIKDGDRVITYDPSKRIYHVGTISSPYAFSEDAHESMAHTRPMKWEGQIERDKLSVKVKNSLGSTLTIFELSESATEEVEKRLKGKEDTPTKDEEEAQDVVSDPKDLLDETKLNAREFIKDKITALDWEDMQELVAGVLRAMGYKTRVSASGPDRGKDIEASPDGLGFEHPRIVVEVKHRPSQAMGSKEIRSYLGGRHKDDRGLYVSTGSFTKDACYEAERASIPLTLIDLEGLVELVIENYEEMDIETRTLLPLTKIYWPS